VSRDVTYWRVSSPSEHVLVSSPLGQGAVVVAKTFGAGAIVTIGFDFFSYDENAARLIGNAVEQSRNYVDSDADGLPNFIEREWGFDPNDSRDGAEDADDDGVTNAGEYAAGTDPFNEDSDGGGTPDGVELALVNDPLDPADDATPSALPIVLHDADGFRWDVQADGSVGSGTGDALATASQLSVDGNPIAPVSEGLLGASGRQVVLGPFIVDQISVVRNIFVPDSGAGFSRWLEVITNRSSTERTIEVSLAGGPGYDGGTRIASSQNGDPIFSRGDDWVVFESEREDVEGLPPPRVGVVSSGAGLSPLLNEFEENRYGFTFRLTLEPGETASLLHFLVQSSTVEAAEDRVSDLAGLGAGALRSISPAFLSSIRNFPVETPFFRGDANGDGDLNLSDPVFLLRFLFLGGTAPDCLEAADVNDDAGVNLSDAITALNYLFLGGSPPPPPGPPGAEGCGLDSGGENLGCAMYDGCQ
ncbi:MAG: hypothetical protein AAF488_19305, partial [Planctomycetota bacterium]